MIVGYDSFNRTSMESKLIIEGKTRQIEGATFNRTSMESKHATSDQL